MSKSKREEMIKNEVEMAEEFLLNEDGTVNMRTVYSLCRNVEREARHLAVKSIQVAANAISNSQDLDKDLARLANYDYKREQAEDGES